MQKHNPSRAEEVKGAEHSHAHHAKMAKHHLSELHKMAKGHKHDKKAHRKEK